MMIAAVMSAWLLEIHFRHCLLADQATYHHDRSGGDHPRRLTVVMVVVPVPAAATTARVRWSVTINYARIRRLWVVIAW